MPAFSAHNSLVLHVLTEFGGMRSGACLAQLLPDVSQHVPSALAELVAEGRVAMEGSGEFTRYGATPADADAPPLPVESESGGLATCFALKREGKILDACAILFERIDESLDRSLSRAALACLELAARYLAEWKPQGQDENERRRYTDQVLSAADTAMYLTKQLSEVLALVAPAREAAFSLGDRRTEALLGLVEACLENMHSERPAERLRQLRSQCMQSLSELDDPGIMVRSQYFLGMFSFWEGDFQQVLVSYEDACRQPQIWTGRFQTELYPLYTSSAALYLGRFHQAVGILESARRAADLEQNRYKIMWWEAQLAMVLLYMNKCDEALELIDHVITEADAESETKILLWGMRGLAYYHWRKGNVRAARRLLSEAMTMAARNALPRPVYSYPWIFDMLQAFHREGLLPVPGFRLERELNSALDGMNAHLKASALRAVAGIRCGCGVPLEETLALLRESLALFEHVGNPLESARTRLRMADCLALLGGLEDAAAIREDARKILAAYDQTEETALIVFPPEDATSLPWAFPAYAAPAPGGRAQAAPNWAEKRKDVKNDPVARCRAMFDVLPPWENLGRFLTQLAHIACSELGAERAVLFRIPPGGVLEAAAASNISNAELNTGVIAARLSRIHAGIGKTPMLLEDEDAVSLTLPLQAGTDEQWLLHLESAYAVRALLDLAPAMREEAAREFSRELHAALRYQNRTASAAPPERELPRSLPYRANREMFLHGSAVMRQLVSKSRQVAAADAPVLILGETGVGKEMLAQYIHDCSGRPGPFVAVHPASITENLFESEFFGHEKGAFTGAHKQKVGLVELAHKGTLFIDEVGDIPAATQIKLLRVFQNQHFLRGGGGVEMHSDFRLVGATNKDLWQEVLAGRFREDLYYRMSVVPLTLPPLRERKEDVPLLVEYFIDRFSRRYHRAVPRPDPAELAALLRYSWPGNVRELKSVVERAVILYSSGKMDYGLHGPGERIAVVEADAPSPENLYADLPTLAELQDRYIQHVLRVTGGKVAGQGGALSILGMKRSTFYARLKAEDKTPP